MDSLGASARLPVSAPSGLTALPAHYRVPYEMFSFEGLSYDEISSRLGLPCRTVGTRINRARKHLRGLLQTRYRG